MLGILGKIFYYLSAIVVGLAIFVFMWIVIQLIMEICDSDKDVAVVVRDYCSAVKKNFGRVREAWKILRRK
nr:MAG TPA: hypothetical protein [Caudoviricetes sp.]